MFLIGINLIKLLKRVYYCCISFTPTGVFMMYLFFLKWTLKTKKEVASNIPHVDRTDIDRYR